MKKFVKKYWYYIVLGFITLFYIVKWFIDIKSPDSSKLLIDYISDGQEKKKKDIAKLNKEIKILRSKKVEKNDLKNISRSDKLSMLNRILNRSNKR